MKDFPRDEALTPGTWKPAPNKYHAAWLKCPNGHIGGLGGKYHTIAPDGTVSPSVVCPDEACTFHEYVRLLDWTPELLEQVTS